MDTKNGLSAVLVIRATPIWPLLEPLALPEADEPDDDDLELQAPRPTIRVAPTAAAAAPFDPVTSSHGGTSCVIAVKTRCLDNVVSVVDQSIAGLQPSIHAYFDSVFCWRHLPMTTKDSRLRPTMNDVAKLAGVSLKTVSRVVNGEPGVSTEPSSG